MLLLHTSDWHIGMPVGNSTYRDDQLFFVDELIRAGRADCRVLPTDSRWFGVTYREDKPFVVASIQQLVDAGEYPVRLW